MSTILVRSLYMRGLDDNFVFEGTITGRQHELGRATLLEMNVSNLRDTQRQYQTYRESRIALSNANAETDTG